jgi:hypothetical protein
MKQFYPKSSHVPEVLINESIVSVSYFDPTVLPRVSSIEIILMKFSEEMICICYPWLLRLINSIQDFENFFA